MFNLKSTNGQVIGASEQDKSDAPKETGIESVTNNAPDATSDDQADYQDVCLTTDRLEA